jgi:Zn-dependent peptidase ImmA (M78 family)
VGVYDHGRQLVTLKPGMLPIQYVCTLMHELGHAHYGHTGISPKQELLANRWAAYRLIRFDDVKQIAGHERTTDDVAASLGVLPSVLRTYMMTLTKAEIQAIREVAAGRAA